MSTGIVSTANQAVNEFGEMATWLKNELSLGLNPLSWGAKLDRAVPTLQQARQALEVIPERGSCSLEKLLGFQLCPLNPIYENIMNFRDRCSTLVNDPL